MPPVVHPSCFGVGPPPRGGTPPKYSFQRLLNTYTLATGYRTRDTGALSTNVGTAGYVWSSSSRYAGDINAGNLNFSSSNVNPLNWNNRANGFSVRCVQASAAVSLSFEAL